MRRILVPLDGSGLAVSILPAARRLAGPDGTLILVRVVDRVAHDASAYHRMPGSGGEEAETYLTSQAELLRYQVGQVEIEVLEGHPVASAIDQASTRLRADMIACATHGRAFLGRLIRGSVAWEVLSDSAVPVLLQHAGDGPASVQPAARRILVPLDGSPFAEAALPLAMDLVCEWGA